MAFIGKGLSNWKTSFAGIASAFLYVLAPTIWPQKAAIWQSLAAVLVALGLLVARDSGTGSDRVGNELNL